MSANGDAANDADMFGSDDEIVPAALVPGASKADSDQDMDDLFGDEDNDVPKDDASRGTSPTPSVLGDGGSSAPDRRRKAMEYEEEDEPQPTVVREAEIPIPNIPIPQSADGNHWILRMPTFVKFDSQPFHPDTYRGPEAELEAGEQAESLRDQSMSIKLEVENTIRWKWSTAEDGTKYRQSNSRVIRWSDGSLSLQLGKEIFDISTSVDVSAATARSTAGAPVPSMSASQPGTGTPLKASASQSQSQSTSASPDTTKPIPHQGLSYLVAQHKTSAMLQVETPITGFMSVRPLDMHSETHRKLVRAVGQKHSKVTRLRLASESVASQDPSAMSAEAIKAAKKKSRTTGGSRRGGGMDDDDDEDREYERARRKQRLSFGRNRTSQPVYSDDDDDEDGYEEEKSPRKSRPSGLSPSKKGKDKEKNTGDYEADDFVVDDPSEGDDEDAGVPAPQDDDGEPDLLDKLDRDIENQARGSGARRAPAGGSDIDIESESEDEPSQTARAKPAVKRIIMEDDEDE